MIKIADLYKMNAPYKAEFETKLAGFFSKSRYINGEEVNEFEKSFANYTGSPYAVGVGNGLDAIRLIFEAYKILGRIQEGDEVLVPANTYVASFLGISQAGLIPVPVDVHADTMNINPQLAETLISSRTKAILPVHLYGQSVDMDEVYILAEKYDLLVIEDAAQAHGVYYGDQKAGALGDAAAFSFYPTKNLGALGDGGIITTGDKEVFEVVKILKNYGQKEKYISRYKGINSRLDEIQALFLNIKLKSLDKINAQRNKNALKYLRGIKNQKIVLPVTDLKCGHVYHQFVLQINANRERFLSYMKKEGIECLIHYPLPPYKQPAYSEMKDVYAPATEYLSRRIVSIPVHEALSEAETDYIIEKINRF